MFAVLQLKEPTIFLQQQLTSYTMFSLKSSSLLAPFLLGLTLRTCHSATTNGSQEEIRAALQKVARIPLGAIAREGTNQNNDRRLFGDSNLRFLQDEDLPPDVQKCVDGMDTLSDANPSLEGKFDELGESYGAQLNACGDFSSKCTVDLSGNSIVQDLLGTCVASGGEGGLYSFSLQCALTVEQEMLDFGLAVEGIPTCIPPECDRNALIQYVASSVDETEKLFEESFSALGGVNLACEFSFQFDDANGNEVVKVSGDGSRSFAELVAEQTKNGSSAADHGRFTFLTLLASVFVVSFGALV